MRQILFIILISTLFISCKNETKPQGKVNNTPCGIYGADFGENEGKNVVVCAKDINTGAWLPDVDIVGNIQDDGSILFSTHIGFTDDGLSGGAWWQGYMHWTRP